MYESVQEFLVAELDGGWSGAAPCTCCGRTSARSAPWRCTRARSGAGSGTRSSPRCRPGPALGLRRIFVLTFEEQFFARHGFTEIDGTPVPPDVFAAMLRSYDAGVAEFLDLAHVKPNTLGNVRMLLHL